METHAAVDIESGNVVPMDKELLTFFIEARTWM
jgi:hypothetical protein